MKYKILFICSMAVTSLFAQASLDSIKVIVHSDIHVRTLKKSTLLQIFLGKKTIWDSGEEILPVVMVDGKTHELVMHLVVEKGAAQFSKYWKRMLFSGQKIPPCTMKQESEVLGYVQSNQGAIGYVSPGFPVEGVSVVEIVDD